MLHVLSIGALLLAGVCCLVLALDVRLRPQKMAVMNVVWPVTTLYLGPLAVLVYFWFGREKRRSMSGGGHQHMNTSRPFWQSVCIGTTHCGAGCTLGDIVAEWGIFLGGIVFFGSPLLTSYAFDFVLAYILGIVFQYLAIAPMKNIHGLEALRASVKADTVSLVAFEIGLFAFMYWMHQHFQPNFKPDQPEYWFLMQVGMFLGFLTSYPANWWLIRKKWKEQM